VRACDPVVQELDVDGLWLIRAVADAADSVLGILVTDPDGDTVVPTVIAGGWSVLVAVPGRWVAKVSSVEGVLYFVANVTAVNALPTLADLRGADPDRQDPEDLGYLGDNSWTDAEIQDALDAETVAQRRVCSVPAAYPADLREALLRRVARNLALRSLPIMMLRGDAEAGAVNIPGRDAEIRRFEAGHRRLVTG
jgi:hypothetical protein